MDSIKGTSKNSNFYVRARKYRPENRSLQEVNEDSRTELMYRTYCMLALQEQKPVTPLSRKKCIFRGALKLSLNILVALLTLCVFSQSHAQETGNDLIEMLIPPVEKANKAVTEEDEDSAELEPGLVDARIKMEQLSRANRFLLTPHKRNYILPVSYHRNPNSAPYANGNSSLAELNHTEAEIQFSIKVLLRENIFGDNGHLYLGYTNHAFWQLYSNIDSAPFRETNHEPELILGFYSKLKIFGFRNVVNEVVLNHQSNGQGELLSRSWNRLMVRSVLERGNLALSLTPWYRIPETEKEFLTDPDGDDNPDITDYMGNFEIETAYKHNDNIASLMLRNAFARGKPTVELGWSSPISRNLRGFVRYCDGYGYSLIDYNSRQQVYSLGVIFTDIF